MGIDAELREQLTRRFEVLLPYFNERQKRLALAPRFGYSGTAVRAVAEAARSARAGYARGGRVGGR